MGVRPSTLADAERDSRVSWGNAMSRVRVVATLRVRRVYKEAVASARGGRLFFLDDGNDVDDDDDEEEEEDDSYGDTTTTTRTRQSPSYSVNA